MPEKQEESRSQSVIDEKLELIPGLQPATLEKREPPADNSQKWGAPLDFMCEPDGGPTPKRSGLAENTDSRGLTLWEDRMFHTAKHLGIEVEPIAVFEGDYLYSAGNNLYFQDHLVHPEFYNLMHIPFALSVSIDFVNLSARYSESEKARRRIVNALLRYLNKRCFERHPKCEALGACIRAVWVVEFGKRGEGEQDRHCHVLLHVHRDAPPETHFEALCDLKSLSGEERASLGIATLDAQLLSGGQAKCVSYFCKVERGREFKVIEYSPNFLPIVQRLFTPRNSHGMKRAA